MYKKYYSTGLRLHLWGLAVACWQPLCLHRYTWNASACRIVLSGAWRGNDDRRYGGILDYSDEQSERRMKWTRCRCLFTQS